MYTNNNIKFFNANLRKVKINLQKNEQEGII
jgi:hypothetical protein